MANGKLRRRFDNLAQSVSIIPMTGFESELQRTLDTLREQNLFRELRRIDSPQSPHLQMGGQKFLNFSSNDYLGLANHPALKAAAISAVKKYGVGSGASRLVCGSLPPHHELEEALADFKRTEAALAFSTGYAAAFGTITALMGSDDVIILDKLVHASIGEAARASGAKLRVFAHNDLVDLEKILRWSVNRTKNSKLKIQNSFRVLIVTESLFSMDGDFAPLTEMVALKEKYGAFLMVDEAHATGIFGKNGRGFADKCGVAQQIEIQMGTLSKAFGVSGGYICGSRRLIDFLVNRSRSFIFSTAPIPAAASAATAAIKLVQSEEGEKRRKVLQQRIGELNFKLKIKSSKFSPIIPLVIGDEGEAMNAGQCLFAQKIFVPAIRYPTVARKTARLRVTLTASHTADDVKKLCESLSSLKFLPKDRTANA